MTGTKYGSRHNSLFNIWKDRIEVINWNIPFNYGLITLDNLRPHAKNPAIANFFSQLDYVEEIGKGTRTLYEYVPMISGGRNPIIDERDEFKVTIPYLMAGPDADTIDDTNRTSIETRKKTREKIIELIRVNNEISTEELATAVGITDKGIEWQLNSLKKSGKLRRIGPANGGHWEVID